MVSGIFHKGSGLGNQLFRYITTRCLALDKGFEFGMLASDLFKGKDFMNLDMGLIPDIPEYRIEEGTGKVIPLEHTYKTWEEEGFYYNPEINYVEDNTIIDGSFEDSRYWEHWMVEINEWLKTEFLIIPNDVCVIGFRGGEFYAVPELGLPKEYFDRAIEMMKEINPQMKFEVHTDDPERARGMFWSRDFHPEVIHDVEINWRSMRSAKHAIIANSSFYILPRLLRHFNDTTSKTIAPKYWNRYNTKKWEFPQNFYKQFYQI